MVSCKHCSTPNSIDSTFCKHCGTALPAADVQLAQEKLNALIAGGNTAFNEGRTDEAMAVAESACASNPSSIPALSLKALCHERKGELALALECADRIVDLNPDSELDRIKRNQLRTKLSASVQLATQPPDRRTALIGAFAAVVLMACIGIGLAKYENRPETVKALGPVVRNDPVQQTVPQQQVRQTAPANTPNQQDSQVSPQPRYQNPPETQDRNTGQNRLNYPDGTNRLPSPGRTDDGDLTIGGDLPVNPPTVPLIGRNGPNTGDVKAPSAPSSPQKGPGSTDPEPRPETQNGVAAQNNDPGVVEIHVSSGPHKTSLGGGVDLGSPGGAQALDKIGIQRYQLGSYASAAATFEQALRSGGDQVSLNQWLGRCYGNMGKKSDQVEAYKRCVTACQTAINSGSGNKDRIHAILDTCQQELKVLQGN